MITRDIAQFALRRVLEDVGVSQSLASEISCGKKRPGLDRAAKIQERGGPEMSAWAPGGDPIASMWERLPLLKDKSPA